MHRILDILLRRVDCKNVNDPHGAGESTRFNTGNSLSRFRRRSACRMWSNILSLLHIKPGSIGIFLTLWSLIMVYRDIVARPGLPRSLRHGTRYSRYAVRGRSCSSWRSRLCGRRLCRQRTCSYCLLNVASRTAECSVHRWTPVGCVFPDALGRWRRVSGSSLLQPLLGFSKPGFESFELLALG